jgi:hypothetical protein
LFPGLHVYFLILVWLVGSYLLFDISALSGLLMFRVSIGFAMQLIAGGPLPVTTVVY